MKQKSKQVCIYQSPHKTNRIDLQNSPQNQRGLANTIVPGQSPFEEGMFLKILIKDVDEEGGNFQMKGQNQKILGLSCDIFVNQVLQQRSKYYNQKMIQQLGYSNTIVPNVVTLFLTKNDLIKFCIFDSSQPHSMKPSQEMFSFQNKEVDNSLIFHDFEKKLSERTLDYSFFSDLSSNKSFKWISFPRMQTPVVVSSDQRKMGYIIDPDEFQNHQGGMKSSQLKNFGENIIKVLFEIERVPLATLSPMKRKIEESLEHYQDPLDENHPAILGRITDILTDLNCLKAFSNYQLSGNEEEQVGQLQNSNQKLAQMQNFLLNLQLALHNRYSSAITSVKPSQSNNLSTPVKQNRNSRQTNNEISIIQNAYPSDQNINSNSKNNNDNSNRKNNNNTINQEVGNNSNSKSNNIEFQSDRNTYQIKNSVIQLNRVLNSNSKVNNINNQNNESSNNNNNNSNSSNRNQQSSSKKENKLLLSYQPMTQSYVLNSGEKVLKNSSKKQQQQNDEQEILNINVNRNQMLDQLGHDEICDDLQQIQQEVLSMYDQLHQAKYFRAYLNQNIQTNNNNQIINQELNEKIEKNEKLHKILYQYTEQIKQNGKIDGDIENKLNILQMYQDRMLEDARICSDELDNLYKKEIQSEKKVKRLKESNQVIEEDISSCVSIANKMKKFNLNIDRLKDFSSKFKGSDFQTKEMQQVFDSMYDIKYGNLKLEEQRNYLKKLKLKQEEIKKGYKIFTHVENPQEFTVGQYFRKYFNDNGKSIPHNNWQIEREAYPQDDYDENDEFNYDQNTNQEDDEAEQRQEEKDTFEQDAPSKRNFSDLTQEQYINDQLDFSQMQNSQLNFQENSQIYKEIKERKSAINNLLSAIDNI